MVTLNVSVEAGLWMVLGFIFGRSFGKQVDQNIQNSRWFLSKSGRLRWLIAASLDFLHHFWIGLLLWFYAPTVVLPTGFDTPLQWFGLGLFIDDLPDVPARFQGLFTYLVPKGVEEERDG